MSGKEHGRTGPIRAPGPVGNRRDLAVCASVILFSFSGQSLPCPGLPLLGSDVLAVLPIDRQQPGNYLAAHGHVMVGTVEIVAWFLVLCAADHSALQLRCIEEKKIPGPPNDYYLRSGCRLSGDRMPV